MQRKKLTGDGADAKVCATPHAVYDYLCLFVFKEQDFSTIIVIIQVQHGESVEHGNIYSTACDVRLSSCQLCKHLLCMLNNLT